MSGEIIYLICKQSAEYIFFLKKEVKAVYLNKKNSKYKKTPISGDD